MLEYWRQGLNEWREYKRWDGKQVINYDLCNKNSSTFLNCVIQGTLLKMVHVR